MRLKKSNYLRVVKYNTDKSSTISYHKTKNFIPSFLINPDHVFYFNGYRTVIITDKTAETINPLNFESKYDSDKFKSAIESKLIKETFTTLKSNIDITTILLGANVFGILAIIYLLLKSMGKI